MSGLTSTLNGVTTYTTVSSSQNLVCWRCGGHNTRGFRDVHVTDKDLIQGEGWPFRINQLVEAKDPRVTLVRCSSFEACHRRQTKKVTGKR